MQLLILSLLVAVASATYSYPSYYSGYGGGYGGGYGSGLYGHSYGGSGGHVSYVLGGHSSDLAYGHAPSYSYVHSKPAVSYVSKPAVHVAPAVHHVAAAPAVSYVSKPAVHHVAAAPAVSYVSKPAVTYVQKPAVTYVQKPAVTYVQKPAVQYVAAAPRVEKYVAAAPAVSTYVAPAPRVEKYVAAAPAVSYAVAAPKATYVAAAPATYSYAAPAAAVSYAAPAAAVSYAAPVATAARYVSDSYPTYGYSSGVAPVYSYASGSYPSYSYSSPSLISPYSYSSGSYIYKKKFSTKTFSKTNTFPPSEGSTKIHFTKGTAVANENASPLKPEVKETVPVPPKKTPKNETNSRFPSEVDWIDITSKSDAEETGNNDVKKSPINSVISKKPTKVENNEGSSRSSLPPNDASIATKKGSSNPVHSDSEERFPSFDSLQNTSKSSEGDKTTTDASHEPVHEIIPSTAEESEFNISEELALPNDSGNEDATSKNRFVPIPDQDYENFGSKIDGSENTKDSRAKQSSVEFVKGTKSAAQFSFDTIPVINRSPRKTSTFENSALSSLISSSDISSFETVDVPLPYYYYKQNQRGELYEHEPTLEYIPDIVNY